MRSLWDRWFPEDSSAVTKGNGTKRARRRKAAPKPGDATPPQADRLATEAAASDLEAERAAPKTESVESVPERGGSVAAENALLDEMLDEDERGERQPPQASLAKEFGEQAPAAAVTSTLVVNAAHGDSENGIAPTEPGSAQTGAILGRVIALEHDRSPNFSVIHGRLNPDIPTLRPGELVAIEATTSQGQASLVISRVSNAWEVNPHEDPISSNLREVINIQTDYAPEGLSTVIYRAIETEPLEELLLGDDGEMKEVVEVQSLPRAGAPIFPVLPEAASAALGLQPDASKGLEIGTLRGSTIPVTLDRSVIQRHIFIGGGIGSGKSYTRGVLAEELQALGVPQINIDVNGELVEAAQELGGFNLVPGKDFHVPLSSLVADDVINAIPSLNGNMIDLVRHAHEELLKESAKTGEPFAVKNLLEKIEDVAPGLEMQPRTTRPAVSRAASLSRLEFLGDPYEWETQLKPGALININCKGMLVSDLRIITATVLRDIQRLAQAKKLPFVVISIDEFHLVSPKDEHTVASQVLREIARIGRHYRIGLILTTQSPQDVDRSILKRLLTRFLHAIEADQLDALRGVFSDASEDLIKQLPKMPQGTCIVTGAFETIKHASIVQIRTRRTTHGGATPDIWSDFERLGWKGKKRPGNEER